MIRRITIRNFRSLADVTVELDPVTALIGKSGTGKSNFVRAVRLLRDVIPARPFQAVSGWPDLAHLMNKGQPISFFVQFSAPGWDESFDYDLIISQSSVIHERMGVSGRTIFSQRNGKWENAPNISPQPMPSGIMLGALNGIPEVTAAFITLTRGIGCYDFPGNVLQPTNQTTSRGGSQRGLSDTGANYLPVIADIISDFQRPRSWKQLMEPLTKLNPAVVAVTLEQPEQNQLLVAYQIGGQRILFNVAQESEGFRRFLAQLLALYQSPPKQTLLFEHPENGIHPGALETLSEQFMACPQEGRGQVILTTHSPQLLDYFDPITIRVVEIHDQKTRIGRLDADQVGVIKDQLMQPGQLLTVDEPRIEEETEVR